MHRRGGARRDQPTHEIAMPALGGEIDRRRRALFPPADVAQIKRLAEPARSAAEKQDVLALRLEGERGRLRVIGEEADAADGGGWQNAAALRLVVERDI